MYKGILTGVKNILVGAANSKGYKGKHRKEMVKLLKDSHRKTVSQETIVELVKEFGCSKKVTKGTYMLDGLKMTRVERISVYHKSPRDYMPIQHVIYGQ